MLLSSWRFSVFTECSGGSSIQSGGRAQKEVSGDYQPQQHWSCPGCPAQKLFNTLGSFRNTSTIGDRDPRDSRKHAVPPDQAPPKTFIQAELSVSIMAGGYRHKSPCSWRWHHSHWTNPYKGSNTQLPNQAQHSRHLWKSLSSSATKEKQPHWQKNYGQRRKVILYSFLVLNLKR